MRMFIQHTTQYHYENAPKHLIQLLRLSPREEAHQRILEWKITTPGKQTTFADAYGNASICHVVHSPKNALSITVQGVVDVLPLHLGVLPAEDNAQSVPPMAYLVPTALTEQFPALGALVTRAAPNGVQSDADALHLAQAICTAVPYTPGKTDATSTAQEAFALASGVCQDHAHIMIAACRCAGIPARYVSGYVDAGTSHAAASHAWVDVWLNQRWVSVDVTNGVYASDLHCRLAIGRDYLDACPIRGIREGGLTEQMDVSVSVRTMQQ